MKKEQRTGVGKSAKHPYLLAYNLMTKLRRHLRGVPPVHSLVSPFSKHWPSPSSWLDTALPPWHMQSTVNSGAGWRGAQMSKHPSTPHSLPALQRRGWPSPSEC